MEAIKFLGGLMQFSVLRETGFEFAKESCLMSRLNKITPGSRTALWDSTELGITTLLKLQALLDKTGLGNSCSW